VSRPEWESYEKNLGVRPCDTCQHRTRCANLELSCPAYDRYIAGRSWKDWSREPDADSFDLAFSVT